MGFPDAMGIDSNRRCKTMIVDAEHWTLDQSLEQNRQVVILARERERDRDRDTERQRDREREREREI